MYCFPPPPLTLVCRSSTTIMSRQQCLSSTIHVLGDPVSCVQSQRVTSAAGAANVIDRYMDFASMDLEFGGPYLLRLAACTGPNWYITTATKHNKLSCLPGDAISGFPHLFSFHQDSVVNFATFTFRGDSVLLARCHIVCGLCFFLGGLIWMHGILDKRDTLVNKSFAIPMCTVA